MNIKEELILKEDLLPEAIDGELDEGVIEIIETNPKVTQISNLRAFLQ